MSSLHFLFLRAINTGSRRLTNDDLLAPLIDAGFADVAAFQAAGNVACRSSQDSTVDEREIERLLTDAYGFDTPVFVRTETQLRSIVKGCPFTDEQVEATTGKIQVTFLRSPISPSESARVAAITPEEDIIEFRGSEWFWLPMDGVSTSKLSVPAVERIVGPMTMRTVGTIERLLKKFAA